MTIFTQSNSVTAIGNGSTTEFSFSFVGDAAPFIYVYYFNGTTLSLLNPSSYTLTINPSAANQIWGIGGSVTYPLSGPPIAVGTYLLIQRTLPLVQATSLTNQGDLWPQVIEAALDTLEMQIQQISSRTTQFRGIWATDISYNVGDIVQDGINGDNTLNYYICQVANLSGVWATDLANGDWTLSAQATVPVNPGSITGVVEGTFVGGVANTTYPSGGTPLLKANNLSDVANATTALTNLGGLKASNNLSDLANVSTAITNLGFGVNYNPTPNVIFGYGPFGYTYMIATGTWIANSNTSNYTSITFPAAFTNKCYGVWAVANGDVNTSGDKPAISTESLSTTGCNIYGDTNGGLTFNHNVPFTYLAIGN